MSREAAQASITTKSKMELSATAVVNLLHRKPYPRPYGSPRYSQMFLKNKLKLLWKLNEFIKLYKK